mmetsp:Transcript_27354/g.57289  ORF Transcript_27354/g.57289 Transcript_27354/m.57289 type:complete len:114 (+) Transcript_27354:493-834(+)
MTQSKMERTERPMVDSYWKSLLTCFCVLFLSKNEQAAFSSTVSEESGERLEGQSRTHTNKAQRASQGRAGQSSAVAKRSCLGRLHVLGILLEHVWKDLAFMEFMRSTISIILL